MTKTPLTEASKKFDLKFLLVGANGSGKSYLPATYTAGPIHYYMFDKGGEKSIYKLLKARPADAPPITIDNFSSNSHNYTSFWKTLQSDAKEGFFEDFAEQNGLVVFDSITNANIKAKYEIAKLAGQDLVQMSMANNNKQGMDQPLWGQLLGWMQTLMSTIQELPCAAVATVHLFDKFDKTGSVINRVPSVNGQLQQIIGIDYDEVYLMECKGSKHTIHFKEHGMFEAKSRVFSAKKLRDFTMDQLATAYLNGDTLEEVKGGGPAPILIKKVVK